MTDPGLVRNQAPNALSAFDHLATMVAVVNPQGICSFANSALEEALGLSRRHVLGTCVFDWFVEDELLRETVAAVASNEFATSRLEGHLRRAPVSNADALAVHVIVNQMGLVPSQGSNAACSLAVKPDGVVDPRRHSPSYDSSSRLALGLDGCAINQHLSLDSTLGGQVVIELIEIEQQARQDREERALDQAQANKELIRNLAHEIKNPLGGIRGAAQLLEMEIGSKPLTEYTQVIIKEADRLQVLVDRLLAPHRKPHVVTDMNIHEVCERVRALIVAEFPKGLQVVRDYDISIPNFLGDPEQLIQTVLNITHNAAQALTDRLAQGDARIILRTRIARQVTLGKQRFRLALELHVEDNGPGIPESLRDRIFYPLVSGREGGSGLGLTLAQTFVQQHQGIIECESTPGQTIFKILMPLG
jgi:two-component system, NtrC family, nitrogen regulation sensor histidine kinase GlnL